MPVRAKATSFEDLSSCANFTLSRMAIIAACFLPAFPAEGQPPSPPEPHHLANLTFSWAREFSGLVRSPSHADIWWTHHDSGNPPELFAFRLSGELVAPPGRAAGLLVDGARNQDWEDITASPDGRLFIGDIGNNANQRRDLCVYVLPEPDPRVASLPSPARRVPFYYPQQLEFPPAVEIFDAEALFWASGSLYLLTKQRSGRLTSLYRFDDLDRAEPQPLLLIEQMDIGGEVTGADATADGTQVVVLTYNAAWLFSPTDLGSGLLSGPAKVIEIPRAKWEAVALDGNSVKILSEDGTLADLPLRSFSDPPPDRLPKRIAPRDAWSRPQPTSANAIAR